MALSYESFGTKDVVRCPDTKFTDGTLISSCTEFPAPQDEGGMRYFSQVAPATAYRSQYSARYELFWTNLIEEHIVEDRKPSDEAICPISSPEALAADKRTTS